MLDELRDDTELPVDEERPDDDEDHLELVEVAKIELGDDKGEAVEV